MCSVTLLEICIVAEVNTVVFGLIICLLPDFIDFIDSRHDIEKDERW